MSTTISDARAGSWAGARVLVLSPVPTAPVTLGNRARILEVNRALRREGARTALLHYPSDEAWRTRLPRPAQAEMARQWDEVFLCPVTRPLHARPAAGPDHAIDEWWDPAIGQMLDWLFRVGRYDALIVNYTWLSKALEHAPPGVLRILDTHDRFAGRRALLAAHGIAPEYFHTTEAEEAIALDRADIVWAIKEQEAEAFRRLTQRPVATLPHVEAAAAARPPRAPDGVLRLGILGGRNSINATNIRAFIQEADAYLRRTLLPVELVIAGSVCGLLEGLRLPWLRMMGEVEEVAAFYDAVDVVLAPLAFSTGLKIKVGEALSRGLPVISHAHAFEGYVPAHPSHDCADFAAMLRAAHRLVREPESIAALAEASRRTAATAREAVARTLAEAGARASRLPPSLILVLRFDQARLGRLAFDHALDVARYAGLRAPVLLHLSGDPAEAEPAALRLLAAAARVAVDPAAGPLPPLVAEALDEETLRREPLSALLAAPHLAAWFVAIPEAPPAGPIATRLGIAHAGLAEVTAARDALAPLARAFPRFLLLEAEPGPAAAALLRASGAERAAVPLLWRGEDSRLLAALRGGRPGPVAILAADAAAPDLLPILAFVTGTIGRPVVLFAAGGALPPGPPSGPLAIRPGTISLAPLAEAFDPGSWRGRRPAFVVEHGRPAGAEPAREIALRAGIPHLRIADPAAPKVVPIPPGPSARARGLASAALVMAAFDRGAGTGQDTAAAEEFARDAGWARIWAELGRLVG